METKAYPKWMYFVVPAIAMMLAWGLRGHIGGGPFGAMIPGAMVALSLCLLLKLPVVTSSVVLVFGILGIGLGGEMTYGQTLGFLRNPETVWWGTLGTTLKGSIWGLLGGTVLSIGFIYDRMPKRTVLYALLIMMAGMLLGFKLINEPMLLYFSDPEKPRSESWAALLLGAISLLIFLRISLEKPDFRLLRRFALLGLVGGGLGFGLGSQWIVLGSHLPDVIFRAWWKAMEFSFGFLLGGFLGYAAWLSRAEIKTRIAGQEDENFTFNSVYVELGWILFAGLITYWFLPYSLEPFVDAASSEDGIVMTILRSIAQILVNYAFYGFVFVVFLILLPKLALQLGIVLTFTHSVVDLVRDNLADTGTFLQVLIIILMSALVAVLTAFLSRKQSVLRSLFLLLIWSCLVVSFLKIVFNPEIVQFEGISFCQIVCGRLIVDIFFLLSSIVLSWMLLKLFRQES